MKLIKFIIKDKISNIGADIRELFDCIKDYIKTTKGFNKEINTLYLNMIKLRYYSFRIKYCKENIIDYYSIILKNNYIWNITDYHEEHYVYCDEGNDAMSNAIDSALGKNNNKTYKVYYRMNMSDDFESEYCKEIKGHTDMIMWCYTNQEEDIISVSRIEL